MKPESEENKQEDDVPKKEHAKKEYHVRYEKFNPFDRKAYEPLADWERKALIKRVSLWIIVACTFLGITCFTLIQDRIQLQEKWNSQYSTKEAVQKKFEEISGDAIPVKTGTFVDNIESVNMKNSTVTMEYLIWFKWEGHPELDMINNYRIYHGTQLSNTILKDETIGNTHYQLARVRTVISKVYDSKCFPLDAHLLTMIVEPVYPAQQVKLVADETDSGINSGIAISGFEIINNKVGTRVHQYQSNHSDPELYTGKAGDKIVISEMTTSILINRSSWGLFFKCFVALYGTLVFVLITLYINTYHRVDPLGMIPSALFGAVANIMVGANLLPDVLEMGLLEYVNFYGVMIILAVMLSVITVNRIRNRFEDRYYAMAFGNIMYYLTLFLVILGNVLLPLCAYTFNFH